MLTVYHPWHGVHYGKNAPSVVNAVIEIPQGSRAKYEVDKETAMKVIDDAIAFYKQNFKTKTID